MPWMLYKNWSGNVLKAKIKIPDAIPNGISGFGKSLSPISLRSGSIGYIVNILPENKKPHYVNCSVPIDYTYAAEIRFVRSENTEVMWKQFSNMHMSDSEETVVIPKKILDNLEIEY